MQSVSPSARLRLAPGLIWGGAKASLGGGVIWSAGMVFLLTFAVARSTATAVNIPGIDVIPLIALGGAVLLALLAVLPVPWPAALGAGIVLGPVVAVIAAAPVIHAQHPTDVLNQQLIGLWWGRIHDGSAVNDTSVYLLLICWLMWISGAWLSWCVLRWRKPMLGLIPGAAAFATNVLNDPVPGDQNGYTLAILVLTLALLLWTNYTSSIASATNAQVKLTGDARWDFWESGLVAMAALIVLGIMLPPLSTVDRTTQMESTLFTNWAQLEQRLSHPGFISTGPGAGGGFTGFRTDVPLGGALIRTRDPVFTYTKVGEFSTPLYFRGVNETATVNGEWTYPSGAPGVFQPIPKNQAPPLVEQYQEQAYAGADVKMLRPPVGNANVLFYPSRLYKLDRPAVALEVELPQSQSTGLLTSIDRLQSAQPPTSAGSYKVTVEYSVATEVELRTAGTSYPDWLQPFRGLPDSGYRSAQVEKDIHDLAQTVVTQAKAQNTYDAAMAIETYLRNNYAYTLSPPQAPTGTDRLWYFLFKSKAGYCEFFASAMGDMLRSIGIPTRLVNGFGPGAFDNSINGFVVRGEDAHTWVESYFPGYGWISFEPTPDNTGGYQPIPRGTQGQAVCLRDTCETLGGTTLGGPGAIPSPSGLPRGFRDPNTQGSGRAGFSFSAPDAGTLTKIVALLAAALLIVFAGLARYLRPRTVMGVWRRMLMLSELAGAKRKPGETPFELGRRLQRTFPEASEPVGALAGGFVVSAYAPAEVAESARSSVMEAWTSVRPLLVRRVIARLRPSRT